MRGPLFQLIASGVVLGMMGGAVVIHALHVAGAKELGEGSGWEAPEGSSHAGMGSFVAPAGVLKPQGARREDSATAPQLQRTATTTVLALEEIVERLQELKAENNNLEGQLKETNRDLMELQFRVDSHSESFRPLPVGPTATERHLLLPPKRR